MRPVSRPLLVTFALLLGASVLAACGGDDVETGGPTGGDPSPPRLLALAARSEPSATADPALAGRAIDAFGGDLFAAVAAVAGEDENVIVSPASVAIALAMLEPGATGPAQEELRALLRIGEPAAFHASMNAFEQSLESRVASAGPGSGSADGGEVTARIANGAYLQRGYPFEPAYLDAIGTHYGPVLNEVDYTVDPDAIADQINEFVAEATAGRITDLVPPGALTVDTVLTLVNALYLKASWQHTFSPEATVNDAFTKLDGSTVTVPMMQGEAGSAARGDGWVAATKPYVGGLSAQFILPDEGRFAEIAANLPAVLELYQQNQGEGGLLVLPRFETRFGTELSAALKALGMRAPYETGNLLGIAADSRMVLDQAIHQTYVAMNEEGTEAAAATGLIVSAVSAPVTPPVPVVLDRPFLFRIVDDESAATLFVGRVLDPTA